jgi:hypothetical protein
MLTDKLASNPELIPINKAISETLDSLIERGWGSVNVAISCQNGRLKTLKISDETIITFKNDTLTP